MKKILVVIGFLIGIMGVKASGISDYRIVWEEQTVKKEVLLEEKFISGNRAFVLSPGLEYEINDKRLINNLAYLANSNSDGIFQATIQMLIWENTTGRNDYVIVDKAGKKVDVSNVVMNIQEELKAFDIDCDLDGNYYEVEYGKSLELRGQISLGNYSNDIFRNENYGSFIRLSNFYKVGLWEVKFDNNIRRYNQYVYAPTPAYKPFEIKVRVLGNVINFNVNVPKNLSYNLVFDVYKLNGDYLNRVEINENNKEIYYALGQDIKLVEVTESPTFILENEIFVYENEMHEYEININKEVQKFEITINTFYVDGELLNNIETGTDVSIYDTNFNYVTFCQSKESCKVELEAGKYLFKDNVTGFIALYEVLDSYNIDIFRNKIKGIITSDIVESSDFEMIKVSNGYLFAEEVMPDIYDFLINERKYKVNLTKNENWLRIENYGLFYKLDYLNEETSFVEEYEKNEELIEKEKVETAEEKYQEMDLIEKGEEILSDGVIEVLVPNTGIDFNINWGWVDVKKRYIFNCNWTFNNKYKCKQ